MAPPRLLPATAALALAACAPMPGPAGDAGPVAPPNLVPLGPVLAAGDALAAAPPVAGALPAQAAALEARAGGLVATTGPSAQDEARLAALAARAEALRAGGLDPAARDRLSGGGASLP